MRLIVKCNNCKKSNGIRRSIFSNRDRDKDAFSWRCDYCKAPNITKVPTIEFVDNGVKRQKRLEDVLEK